jgi:hypothetical protein
MFIFKHIRDVIAGKRLRIGTLVSEGEKIIPVVSLQSINSGDPHISFMILHYFIYNVGNKTIARAEMGKCILLCRLCKGGDTDQQASGKRKEKLQNKGIDLFKYKLHQANFKITKHIEMNELF